MRTTMTCTVLAAIVLASGVILAVDPPGLMNYQGVLRDDNESPLDGTYDMIFRFYDDADPAGPENEILVDEHLASGTGAVTVSGGLFDVVLGSGNFYDGSGPGDHPHIYYVFGLHETVYLEVQIGAEILQPRMQVVSAPYAIHAAVLGGYTPSDFINTGSEQQEKTGLLRALGGVDFGNGAHDDLTAGEVTGLTSGPGNFADFLHSHSYANNADSVDGMHAYQFINITADPQEKIGRLTVLGGVDYGYGADDDLAAADVETLTSGGAADALHTHDQAGDADTLDTIDSAQFLRADQADVKTAGDLTLDPGVRLLVDDGSASLPGLAFRSDLNTGLALTSANTVAITTAGSVALETRANGDLEIGGRLFMNASGNAGAVVMDYDGPDGYQAVLFYEDGSWNGEQFAWHDSEDQFVLSDDVLAQGMLSATWARFDDDLHVGYGSSTDDDAIYFDGDWEQIVWENTQNRFRVTNDFRADGNVHSVGDEPGFRLYAQNGLTLLGSLGANDPSNYSYFYDGQNGRHVFYSDPTGIRLGNGVDASAAYVVTTRSLWARDGAQYGIAGEGASGGGFFSDSDESGKAWVAYGKRGIYAQGNHSGAYFWNDTGQAWAEIAYNEPGTTHKYGVAAFGKYAGGYFADEDESGYAYIGHGTNKVLGSGAVSFVQNHPYDTSQVVVYTAPEGDEAATYTRGTARLENGEARVALSETFAWVTNPDIGLTAHVTPRSPDAVIYVESVSTEELVVRNVTGFPVDAVFDYLVYGLRIGFEERPVVRPKERESFIPSMAGERAVYEQAPELRSYNPMERFKAMHAAASSVDVDALDFSVSLALREAIHEYDAETDPPVDELFGHGPRRERAEPGLEIPSPAVAEQVGEELPLLEPSSVAADSGPQDVEPETRLDSNELFPVGEPVEAGDLLALDPQRPGVLVRAATAQDPGVGGIAAGASVTAENELRVELVETNYAVLKVDAGYGEIRPGDLLTSSFTPGHAMRAAEFVPGTIVGKALQALETGTGSIKVLVIAR